MPGLREPIEKPLQSVPSKDQSEIFAVARGETQGLYRWRIEAARLVSAGISLTEAGRGYYRRCVQILQDLGEA